MKEYVFIPSASHGSANGSVPCGYIPSPAEKSLHYQRVSCDVTLWIE